MAKSFGRDELNALIGGHEEMAAFRQSTSVPKHQHSTKRNPKEEVDFSKLSAAETAALLSEKRSAHHQHSAVNNPSRYRAKSSKQRLAHHSLLEEELSKRQQQLEREEALMETNLQQEIEQEGESNDDDDEQDFVKKRLPAQPAVVIRRRQDGKDSKINRSRHRAYDSSSSSSVDDSDSPSSKRKQRRRDTSDEDDDDVQRRVKRADDSDSSSSDDENDDRRRRVLATRRAQSEPTIVTLRHAAEIPSKPQLEKKNQPEITQLHPKPTQSTEVVQRKPKPTNQSSPSSSSSSGSDDASDSSSGESDSSDEEEPVMPKIKFIPKHKRNLMISEETKWEEEERKLEIEKEQEKRRKMQSRALVAKQLAEVDNSRGEEDDDDEIGGATNPMPNDDDDIDNKSQRYAWELRELGRLLRAMEEATKRQLEEDEYQRRKNMTDAECLEEDKKIGRFQAPGVNRQNRDQEDRSKHLQRFYHRGAFYMDESEWGEGDVREKAAEYAMAATGEDKIDKSKLPKVMQVKGFGRARQNQKYKGLASEDTTDKSTRFLPIVHGSKQKKQA
ncbi:microfibril-associated/pre-mRNA processing [Nitzschia inconspicua]|uniref:Microfibril-associated/pre-mRNA processing n=1 Tax=Nitzschia inconspicua TaxID=303405 RepID=A0A9K3L314_9STRA|nr:microfibril-associated/pre-mRNA processing [Nitzschia inconspicua]